MDRLVAACGALAEYFSKVILLPGNVYTVLTAWFDKLPSFAVIIDIIIVTVIIVYAVDMVF